MRVLFDTNVLLDALLAREYFMVDSVALLDAIDYSSCDRSTTISNVSSRYIPDTYGSAARMG